MRPKDLTVVLLVVLGVFVLLPALGMLFMGPGSMGPMMGRGMWGGGVWGLVLLLAAIVAVVVLLSRRPVGDDPVVVLKRRLARGEITKEQYADLKNALQQS